MKMHHRLDETAYEQAVETSTMKRFRSSATLISTRLAYIQLAVKCKHKVVDSGEMDTCMTRSQAVTLSSCCPVEQAFVTTSSQCRITKLSHFLKLSLNFYVCPPSRRKLENTLPRRNPEPCLHLTAVRAKPNGMT